MANICDCCGKKNNSWVGDPMHLSGDKLLCYKCASHIQHDMTMLYSVKEIKDFNALKKSIIETSNQHFSPEIVDAIKETIEQRRIKLDIKSDEEHEKIKQLSKETQDRYDSLIMTTGSMFEGYRVEKYIDIVCVESVFKNSFAKRFSAGMEDFGNMLSFKETEMTGANELISSARKYVLEKFKMKAAEMGANAVLGVEFESSFGSDVVRVAIFGTAVTIKKLD